MTDVGTGEKLKVFISYSRRDSAAFADELVAGLELAGFAPKGSIELDTRPVAKLKMKLIDLSGSILGPILLV